MKKAICVSLILIAALLSGCSAISLAKTNKRLAKNLSIVPKMAHITKI